MHVNYLVISKVTPKACDRALIRIGRQHGMVAPDLIHILQDDHRLGDRAVVMNKHRDLFVNGVKLEECFALVSEILFNVFKLNVL